MSKGKGILVGPGMSARVRRLSRVGMESSLKPWTPAEWVQTARARLQEVKRTPGCGEQRDFRAALRTIVTRRPHFVPLDSHSKEYRTDQADAPLPPEWELVLKRIQDILVDKPPVEKGRNSTCAPGSRQSKASTPASRQKEEKEKRDADEEHERKRLTRLVRMQLRRAIPHIEDLHDYYASIPPFWAQSTHAAKGPSSLADAVKAMRHGAPAPPPPPPDDGGGGDLLLCQLWRFASDAGFIGNDAELAKLNKAVYKAFEQFREFTDPSGLSVHDPTLGYLNPTDFAEAIIRIAHVKYRKIGASLPSRLASCVMEVLAPLARQIRLGHDTLAEDVRAWYTRFHSSLMGRLLVQDRVTVDGLRKVYDHYRCLAGGVQPGPESAHVALNVNGLLGMFEDLGLLDVELSTKKLVEHYRRITKSTLPLVPQQHPNNAAAELVFEEFLQVLALAALTQRNRLQAALMDVSAVLTEYIVVYFGPAASTRLPFRVVIAAQMPRAPRVTV